MKALSHEHNYHHPEEETLPDGDDLHDPGRSDTSRPACLTYDKKEDMTRILSSAQHTEAAERMRFRRTMKIVDKMLEEDDSNKDGLISFPEFMSAYHARRLDGLKLRKVKNEA